MVKVRWAIMRGGTSKAIFFYENELPPDPKLRDKVVLDVRRADLIWFAESSV